MQYITVIKGDTLDLELELDYPENTEIDRVVFSCKTLSLNVELDQVFNSDDEPTKLYTATIPASTTANFYIGNFTYDVTAYINDNKVCTVLYNEPIEVLEKCN